MLADDLKKDAVKAEITADGGLIAVENARYVLADDGDLSLVVHVAEIEVPTLEDLERLDVRIVDGRTGGGDVGRFGPGLHVLPFVEVAEHEPGRDALHARHPAYGVDVVVRQLDLAPGALPFISEQRQVGSDENDVAREPQEIPLHAVL